MINIPVTLVETKVSSGLTSIASNTTVIGTGQSVVLAEVQHSESAIQSEVSALTPRINHSTQAVIQSVGASITARSTIINIAVHTTPFGGGDMYKLIYDPLGKQTNAFDAGNLVGHYDCGTFN